MPWTLREQKATATLPHRPKQRVEVLMDMPTYSQFLTLRRRVMDDERNMLLEGDELHAALAEMHNLVEMTYLLDAQVVEGPLVETVMDEAARTEALASVESLESNGWKIPEKVKDAIAAGQTTLLDVPPVESKESHVDPF